MYISLGIILFLFLIVLIVGICYFVIKTSIKEREVVISKSNLLFLAPVFLTIYTLYVIAWLYNDGSRDFFSFFSLIAVSLEALGFAPDKSILLPICEQYPIYYADFVLAFIASGASVILSIASFFGARIRNFCSRRIFISKGCDIVIGDSADSVIYANDNKFSIMVAPNICRSRYNDIIKSGITVVTCSIEELAKILKQGRSYNLIAFRDSNLTYTAIIDDFIKIRAGRNIKLYIEADFSQVKIIKDRLISNVVGDMEKSSACSVDKVDKAKKIVQGYISCFSRHELIARQFVWQYPISKYIPRNFYNPNFTIKNDKNINVVFVGFGKMNYQLFRICAMQFQFAAQKGEKLCSKPVHYFIYDNHREMLNNETFSMLGYEFDKNFAACDFPAPERICDIAEVEQLDINSVEAKMKFCEIVTPDSFTYFIVSLKSDLEDASYAQTLKRVLPQEGNWRIFVRAKSSEERLNDNGIITFGDEREIFLHETIVNDKLSEVALRMNMFYDAIDSGRIDGVEDKSLHEIERDIKAIYDDAEFRKRTICRNESRPIVEQMSNLYRAVNLPFKLAVMGFGLEERDGEEDCGVSQSEYRKVYVKSVANSESKEDIAFFETQSANVLAFMEHARWNALYILNDYKQEGKKDMVLAFNDKGEPIVEHKDISRKLHACITTYYGIKQVIEYKFSLMYPDLNVSNISLKDRRLSKLYNLYAYDYNDLDRLYGVVLSIGYKIVRLSDNP